MSESSIKEKHYSYSMFRGNETVSRNVDFLKNTTKLINLHEKNYIKANFLSC